MLFRQVFIAYDAAYRLRHHCHAIYARYAAIDISRLLLPPCHDADMMPLLRFCRCRFRHF